MNLESVIRTDLNNLLPTPHPKLTLRHIRTFELRNEVVRTGNVTCLVLDQSINVLNDEVWDKLESCLWYLKEFGGNGAHPSKFKGHPITLQECKMLIDTSENRCSENSDYDWDDLKSFANECLDHLKNIRRGSHLI